MENLNAEAVKKSLECCNSAHSCSECPYCGNCYDGKVCDNALALITSQEQRIKGLTEENERLVTALANYEVRIAEEYYTAEAYEELREENERLKELMSMSSLQGAIIGGLRTTVNELTADKERLEKLLDDKCDRCIERDRADTVKEFAERLIAEFRKDGRMNFYIRKTLEQITKEMLKEEKQC